MKNSPSSGYLVFILAGALSLAAYLIYLFVSFVE